MRTQLIVETQREPYSLAGPPPQQRIAWGTRAAQQVAPRYMVQDPITGQIGFTTVAADATHMPVRDPATDQVGVDTYAAGQARMIAPGGLVVMLQIPEAV